MRLTIAVFLYTHIFNINGRKNKETQEKGAEHV